MAIGDASVTSGVGRGAPTAALEASWTRKYWPGANDTLGSGVSRLVAAPKIPVPLALVYWTDQPASEALAVPRLKSSM